MTAVTRARLLIALVVTALVGVACGGSDPEPVGLVIQVENAVAEEVVDSTTSTTTTTVDPAVPTTTVRPPEPFETFVAAIRPEVTSLVGYDAPHGDPVAFEFNIANPTYFGNQLQLMVIERTPDGQWLNVQIPVRPNGTEAWIPAGDAEVSSHFFRAEVDLVDRWVRVWDGENLMAETGAVVGTESTPTPVGRFFVNDLVEKWEGSAYGPYILSLSGFSEVLETFGGGVPVIAIHGTNRPELIGGAHSNGCIRIPNDVVSFLARLVPIGTPVDIVA